MAQQAINPIPKGFHSLTPQLWFDGDCRDAIEFYEKALGALVIGSVEFAPDDRVMHAVLHIGDSTIFLADTMGSDDTNGPEHYATTSFYLYVQDSDKVFNHAVNAGCKVLMPIEDTFWGDRVGEVRDPYGHCWSIATNKWVLSLEEVHKAQEEWLAKHHAVTA